MTIKHKFRSGNGCDISVPAKIIKGEFNQIRAEWDDWPPSEADIQEYVEEVYPNQVIPVVGTGVAQDSRCRATGRAYARSEGMDYR